MPPQRFKGLFLWAPYLFEVSVYLRYSYREGSRKGPITIVDPLENRGGSLKGAAEHRVNIFTGRRGRERSGRFIKRTRLRGLSHQQASGL